MLSVWLLIKHYLRIKKEERERERISTHKGVSKEREDTDRLREWLQWTGGYGKTTKRQT